MRLSDGVVSIVQGDNPFIEIEVDGCRNRCDDRAIFGELGAGFAESEVA